MKRESTSAVLSIPWALEELFGHLERLEGQGISFAAEATFFSEPIADLVAAAVTTVLFLRTFPGILRDCVRTHSAGRTV